MKRINVVILWVNCEITLLKNWMNERTNNSSKSKWPFIKSAFSSEESKDHHVEYVMTAVLWMIERDILKRIFRFFFYSSSNHSLFKWTIWSIFVPLYLLFSRLLLLLPREYVAGKLSCRVSFRFFFVIFCSTFLSIHSTAAPCIRSNENEEEENGNFPFDIVHSFTSSWPIVLLISKF